MNEQARPTSPSEAQPATAPPTHHHGVAPAIAAMRVALWLTIALAALALPLSGSDWTWRAAAFACAHAAASALLARRRPAARPYPHLDVAVDLMAATAVVATTGGFTSPLLPLTWFVTACALALLGHRGGLVVAASAVVLSAVHFRTTADLADVVVYGCASGALLLAAAALGLAESARERSSSLLRRRTLEDVEAQVEHLDECNRQMRATVRELNAVVRDQRARADDAAAAHRIIAATVDGTDPGALHASALQVLAEAVNAGVAALWLREPGSDRLVLRAAVGSVDPCLPHAQVDAGPDTQPHSVRKECEALLAAASAAAGPSLPAIPGGRATLGALLRDRDQVTGVVAVGAHRSGAFTEDHASRLSALAPAAALACRGIEDRVRLSRAIREVSLLHEVARLADTAGDTDGIYAAVGRLIARGIPCENCTVYAVDRDAGALVPKGTHGSVVNLLDQMRFSMGFGVEGWLLEGRKHLVVADALREPSLAGAAVPPSVRSFLAAPMTVQGAVVGAIVASHARPNAFSREDLRLLSALAGQSAASVERLDMRRSLERMAITDGLTSIYNHRYFRMRLQQEVERARRYSLNLAVLIMDIDRFKEMNDQHGHAVGDAVLAEMAGVLHRNMRSTEIVARYGGDEFVALLPQTDADQAAIAAERMLRRVREHRFGAVVGAAMRVTVSIGIAALSEAGEAADRLMERADGALYRAKREGRNQMCVAPSVPASQEPEPPVRAAVRRLPSGQRVEAGREAA